MLRPTLAIFLLLVPISLAEPDLITFCRIRYVRPGEEFRLRCSSPRSSGIKLYTPRDVFPSSDELDTIVTKQQHTKGDHSFSDFKNATRDQHAGNYTCVAFHGFPSVPGDPPYSIRRCEVIMDDPCEDSGCSVYEKCVADMSDGSSSCTCDFECDMSLQDFLCTDTCEFYTTECLMREAMCRDGKQRERESSGFCPNPLQAPDMQPRTAAPEMVAVEWTTEVAVFEGESITLSAGVLKEGTPVSKVRWTFFPDSGELVELATSDKEFELRVDSSRTGVYQAEVVHCAEPVSLLRYEVSIKPPITTPTTEGPAPGPLPVCSVFPGGVIEDFQGTAVWYDLACSHVLGADVMPGGDYTTAWYIYGTFDQLDGITALSAMTFYVGQSAFEFQRGWIVSRRGGKFPVKEDEMVEIPNTGCYVEYRDLHLQLECPFFQAYYDGVMSGHVRIRETRSTLPYVNTPGNLGLCFGSDFGWRTNWRVGSTSSRCRKVSGEDGSCAEQPPDSCGDYRRESPLFETLGPWSECEAGPVKSCNEIQCGEKVARAVQLCALQQAARVMCALKYSKVLGGEDEECPVDECEWKRQVVARGCPQEELPFVCIRSVMSILSEFEF